jgi:tRNA threonylcarbamoyladenosine biosynthesis protein TsaE
MERSECVEFLSASPQDTDRFGQIIAGHLQPSMLVALIGTLGAGKTYLVQSIAEALGVDRRSVVSPTFTLVQHYAAKLDLIHIDAYRIRDRDEYNELGIDEMLGSESVVLIEWADRIAECLPDRQLAISITIEPGDARKFHVCWPRADARLDEVGRGIRGSLKPEETPDATDRLPPFGF